MSGSILVRGARQVVTLRGASGPRRGAAMRELGVLENASVLIVDGKIKSVGTSADTAGTSARATGGTETYDATGKMVLPGFVDSHTHLVWARPRLIDYEMRVEGSTYAEIAAAGGGILSTVKATREASESTLLERASSALAAFYANGTTTVEAKSGYGLDDVTEMKSLNVIAALANEGHDVIPTYLGAHVPPPEYKPDEYIKWIASEMLPKIAQRRLAVFADAFCEHGAFTLEQTRTYLEAARRNGLGLKLHAEQFSRSGAAMLGVEMGAASVDHLESAGSEDADALAGSSTIATLLPGAVFHLGLSRYPPARMLIDRGAAVALATDYNPGTSPTASMPMILSLACTQMRMTPAEAIAAATINGAHALGIAGRVGSIEEGKDGNLVVFDADDYREIPYHFGMNLVAATIYRGVLLGKTTG
jgi:imidazolonepropionase